ncbi:methionine ABC transporter permease [Streptomyces sp. NPDC059740]|uniref:methionine ABC transporter permease n=1 Tax=Streptomyces sp. NPDC059740 TaxID=3346926 RepID=UPI003656C6B3
MTWDQMQPLLRDASLDTLFMVWWSTLYSVLGGLVLGIVLALTDRGGLLCNAAVNKVLGAITNIGRSLPFLILTIALIPFTQTLVGTSLGPSAAVVPLTIGAIPFFARLVEVAVREVDPGLVEAAQAMGGGTWTVVFKVLLPQALPSLVAGVTTTVVALIGYSAMAGTVGGGGLGNLAIVYGYQRFETGLMVITVVLLIVLVTLVQLLGDLVVRRLTRRSSRADAPVRLLRSRRTRTTAAKAPATAAPQDEPVPAAERADAESAAV